MKIKGTEVGTGRPLICVPVLEKTKEEVIKEVEYLVKSDADMIEWRLDAFEHYTDYNEVREILQQIAPLLKKKTVFCIHFVLQNRVEWCRLTGKH